MDVQLCGVLRERFETAWSIVPKVDAPRLDQFIRSVSSVAEIDGAAFECANGQMHIADGPASGYCYFDNSAPEARAVILLADKIAQGEEPDAVAVILHEISHAAIFLDDRDRASVPTEDASELAACCITSAWVARSGIASPLTRGILKYNYAYLTVHQTDVMEQLLTAELTQGAAEGTRSAVYSNHRSTAHRGQTNSSP